MDFLWYVLLLAALTAGCIAFWRIGAMQQIIGSWGGIMARHYRSKVSNALKAADGVMHNSDDGEGLKVIQEPRPEMEAIRHAAATTLPVQFNDAQLALADLYAHLRSVGEPMDAGRVAGMIAIIEGMADVHGKRTLEEITE